MDKDRFKNKRGKFRGSSRGGFGRGFRGRGFGGNRDRGNSWPKENFNYQQNWSNGNKSGSWQSRETPGKRLTEQEIGVLEHMSEHEGFSGIIKSRYSDFQVSEINLQGEVAKLTDQEPPEPPQDEQVYEDEDLLTIKYNIELLPMETWDRINALITKKDAEAVEIDVTSASKEDRTKIHEAVKKAFGPCIVGTTVTRDDKKYVCFDKHRKGVRVDKRVKWIWPAEFVYFIVYKENCDTMDAAVRITERLGTHMKPSLLGFAGTKDRRAKTTQWFSAKKIDPRKIAASCRHMRDVHVGNYTFHKETLKLGMLNGNRFRVCLRNVTCAESAAGSACAALARRGFINYYGHQRFGTQASAPTFQVGKYLLQGNFQQAIDTILCSREGPLQQALQVYHSDGARAAVDLVPPRSRRSPEARLLDVLALQPKDLQTALHMIPRNTRLLYLHAYQSLVWNRCVSERVRRLQLQVAVGDLVPQADLPTEEIEPEAEIEDDTTDDTTDDPTDKQTNKLEDKPQDKQPNKKQDNNQERPKIPVKVLTQEDVDSGCYSILNVVMPLPGYNIEYPPNMKDYYEKVLKEDNLTLELRTKYKSYSMSGTYRHIVTKPVDLSWECVRYSDPHADLIASDLDLLQGRDLTGAQPDGKYKALLLTFSLPVSSYATMALRELMKVDTASDTQAKLNNYHKRSMQDDSEHSEKKTKTDE